MEIKKPASGNDEHEQKPKPKDTNDNEALGSKGKGNLVDDDEEEEDQSEEAQLKRKKHDQQLDEAQCVTKEAEEAEKNLVKPSYSENSKASIPYLVYGKGSE